LFSFPGDQSEINKKTKCRQERKKKRRLRMVEEVNWLEEEGDSEWRASAPFVVGG